MNYLLRQILVATALVMMTMGSIQGNYQEDCLPTSCCQECCGNFFFDAGLLCLRAYQGGLSNACDDIVIIDTTEDGRIVSRLEGENHDLNFNWNVGFRIGAGYEFANSNCGVGAFWTHFNSCSHRRGEENRQHWKLHFDVVDAVYGCQCDWSSCLALTPYGGLRYAKIDQKLRTDFVSYHNRSPIHSTGYSKENFSGLGPVIGVDCDWNLGCGFSLYGDLSGAILYGRFHVRSNHIDLFDTGVNITHLRSHIHACQPVLDVGLGVRWRTCLCDDKLLIVQLGVEEHRYFNHNQFCGYGDLSLDGVSLAVGIQF